MITTEQKAKLRDDLMSWADVSIWGHENDPNIVNEIKESITNYILWMYHATEWEWGVMEDWDTDYVNGDIIHDNKTRWMLTPIQDEAFIYWYKKAKIILDKKSNKWK